MEHEHGDDYWPARHDGQASGNEDAGTPPVPDAEPQLDLDTELDIESAFKTSAPPRMFALFLDTEEEGLGREVDPAHAVFWGLAFERSAQLFPAGEGYGRVFGDFSSPESACRVFGRAFGDMHVVWF